MFAFHPTTPSVFRYPEQSQGLRGILQNDSSEHVVQGKTSTSQNNALVGKAPQEAGISQQAADLADAIGTPIYIAKSPKEASAENDWIMV